MASEETEFGVSSTGAVPAGSPVPVQAPPAILKRYEVLAEVGRGGMGIVYKARDRETGETVAVKVIRPEIAADDAVMERFKNELRLARKITHKNVCRIHEFNRAEDSTAYISMEFVEGESLREILDRFGSLPVLKIVQQICSGLREAHLQGVVHRDLKPENLMLDRSGSVKIMDFGVARSTEGSETRAGTLVGTPAYMSPEQTQGTSADARSDIYSLGLILYEMFTGQAAFKGESGFALALMQIHEKPPGPREIEPAIPAHVEMAILKCLEKAPGRRFQTVTEFEEALGELQPLEPSAETDPVPPPHLSLWARTDFILLGAAIIGLFYFLAWNQRLFPGSNFVLEIDGVTARREAQRLIERLGHPAPPGAPARLEYKPHEHALELVSWIYLWHEVRMETLPKFPFPLYWRINLDPPRGPQGGEVALIDLAATGAVFPERYAVLDRQGKLKELVFTDPATAVPLAYKPPSPDERRQIARKFVEEACGPLPARSFMSESSGGERNASYSATWKPEWNPGTPWNLADISLQQEKVARLSCRPEPANSERINVQPIFRQFFSLLAVWAIVRLLFLFGRAQCHRLPIFWKRLPWAVLLGAAGGWVITSALSSASPAVSLAIGVAFLALSLVAMVAVEHQLRGRARDAIAASVLALRGRFQNPCVVLGVLRGGLAGLVLAALQTALAHLSALAFPIYISRPGSFFSAFLDPKPAGYALASFSPALFTVFSALLHGLWLGLILLGLDCVDASRKAKKRRFRVFLPGFVFIAISGWPLHAGTFEGMFLGFVICSGVWALALGWIALNYDLLTAVVAVATATLWSLNWPLLHMLREVGNQAQWAVFAGWAAVLAFAALAAFRVQLRQYLTQH